MNTTHTCTSRVTAHRVVAFDDTNGTSTVVGEFTEFGDALDATNRAENDTFRFAFDARYECGCYSTDR